MTETQIAARQKALEELVISFVADRMSLSPQFEEFVQDFRGMIAARSRGLISEAPNYSEPERSITTEAAGILRQMGEFVISTASLNRRASAMLAGHDDPEAALDRKN